MLANALDGIKCHISANGDTWTTLLYVPDGFDYVLSNGGMILAVQGPVHSIRITEIEK